MISNRNTSRRPINLRDMNDSNMKMELNEFVGLKTPCDEKIDCNMENMPIAMAYVPFQQSGEVYACDRALSRGTIFPCLDLPFLRVFTLVILPL